MHNKAILNVVSPPLLLSVKQFINLGLVPAINGLLRVATVVAHVSVPAPVPLGLVQVVAGPLGSPGTRQFASRCYLATANVRLTRLQQKQTYIHFFLWQKKGLSVKQNMFDGVR